MRVAVGAILGAVGGPAVYALELIAAMNSLNSEVSIIVLTDQPESFRDVAETVTLPLHSAWEQPFWDQWKVPRALRGLGVDLYHGTKGVLGRSLRCPAVVTIHDLAVYRMPETFSFAQRLHQQIETPSTLRRAEQVIAVSAATAADIAHFFPDSGARTTVVHNGLSTRGAGREPTAAAVQACRQELSLGGPVVGYLGTIQPRKNVDRLVEAFLEVAQDDWALLLAGRIRPGYRPDFLANQDPRVRYLGPISEEEVPVFLRALDLMVSPSSYEGFGLTLIEAMAAGTPVVSINASAIPEVVGSAGVLVPPDDTRALAAAIARVIGDPQARFTMATRGRARASQFSWRDAGKKTLQVYRDALESHGAGGASSDQGLGDS
jgi:glycosyltransferase involved in cell wall biosynthesis